MKFYLIRILTVFMFLMGGNTSIGATIIITQIQNEREFNQGFKENYSGRKYNYQGKAKALPSSGKRGTASKYSQDSPYGQDDNDSDGFSITSNIFNWSFIIILIFAVGYLAYILLNEGSSALFSSRKNQNLPAHGEITAENIQNTDIETLITNAESLKDYRLAIRYYYLLVLKQLSLNNFITFEDDKTNAEYMSVIAPYKFSQDFSYISYIYDYTWYGEFSLNQEQYFSAKESFIQLVKDIRA